MILIKHPKIIQSDGCWKVEHLIILVICEHTHTHTNTQCVVTEQRHTNPANSFKSLKKQKRFDVRSQKKHHLKFKGKDDSRKASQA